MYVNVNLMEYFPGIIFYFISDVIKYAFFLNITELNYQEILKDLQRKHTDKIT